jgi:hypothetical protein
MDQKIVEILDLFRQAIRTIRIVPEIGTDVGAQLDSILSRVDDALATLKAVTKPEASDWTNHAHHTQPVAGCHLCKAAPSAPMSESEYRAERERLIAECRNSGCMNLEQWNHPSWGEEKMICEAKQIHHQISALDAHWQQRKKSLDRIIPKGEPMKYDLEPGYEEGIAAGRKMALAERLQRAKRDITTMPYSEDIKGKMMLYITFLLGEGGGDE